jgi:hypothetical protein
MLMVLLLFTGRLSAAQNASEAYSDVRKDIDIMETVLDKLFDIDKSEFRFFTGRSRGYYLDEYGVLFRINHSPFSERHDFFIKAERDFEKAIIELETFKSSVHSDNREDDVDEQDIEKKIEETQLTLLRFLGDYASSMNSLEPHHRITVVIELDSHSRLFAMSGNEERRLVANVKFADILSYRRGKLNQDQFNKIVRFEIKTGDSEMDEDIDLFADILESTLDRAEKRVMMNLSRKIAGFYVHDYGALFTFSANFHPYFVKYMTDPGEEKVIIKGAPSLKASADVDAGVNELESRVKDIVSRFGHTLRFLDNDEWIEIVFEVDPLDDYSTVILKTKKNDIDRMNQREIDKDELNRRMKIIRY